MARTTERVRWLKVRHGLATSWDVLGPGAVSLSDAWLRTELGSLGTQVEVQDPGQRHPATVAADPLFDPEMRRMRS